MGEDGVRGDELTRAIMRTAVQLAEEVGYAKLSLEGVAARAGVGKHTIYRRWPSKGALFLDSVLSTNEPLDFPDTGDALRDAQQQARAAVDLLARPPLGSIFRALVAEAQRDPAVLAALNERFVRPQAEKLVAGLALGRERGQVAADFDLDLAMAICSGPLYFCLLITEQEMTHEYVDRLFAALFAGMAPRP